MPKPYWRRLRSGSAPVGTATLLVEWSLPVGSIDSQTVYYDTVSRMGTENPYAYFVTVPSAVVTSKVLTGLFPGTYYWALTSTEAGVESDLGLESSGVAA